MPKLDKNFVFMIFAGALLIAGLLSFFLVRKTQTESSVKELKPSQLDFSKGNSLQPPAKVPDIPDQKVQLQKTGELTAEDQKKWETFQEVLNSKNDNDPRIDKDLKNLSPELRQNLETAYSALPAENRNGRGFIAFLIARELHDVRDVQFLHEILKESPCLSFQSCERTAPPDPHFDGINETSLNYPQIATLYQIQKRLEADPGLLQNPELKAALQQLLRDARQFPSAAIQKRAEEIQSKIGS